MSSTLTMWDEHHQLSYGYLSDVRTPDPGDSSTFHLNSLALAAGSPITHSTPPASTFAHPMNRNHTLDFPSDSSLSELHVPSDEINRAEGGTITQGHRSTVSDSGIDGAGAPTSSKKSAKKRKAADMEILTGKQLIDTYCKRSNTLMEKGMELEKLTGAYVVIYTARPESIGEGRYRLHMSDNLRKGDCTLMKDISAAVDAIEAASKAAHLSRPDVHRRKKVRTDRSGGQSADLDLEIACSTPRGTSTQRTSTTNVTGINGGPSSNGSAQAPLNHPDEVFTHPTHATSNTIATSTASGIPVNTGIASRTPSDTGTMYVPFEKDEISSLVHLLNSDSRDVQLCGLAIIRKLVVSEYAVQAVHDANVISHLVELLEQTSDSNNDVACQSALILSQMAQYRRPCVTMITAGAIPSLTRLLSLPIGDTMLAVVAKTMGQCAIHQRYYRRFSSLFPRDVLQPLINLLQSDETEVCIVAARVINGIASSGSEEVLRFLLDEGVVPQLCHLSSKCTNLLALVASAIGRIISYKSIYGREDDEDIKRYVLRPLVDLLGHGKVEVQIRATRALHMLARDRPLVKLWGKTTVLPHIIPLISSDNDELFVEALSSALRWTYNDNYDYLDVNRPEYVSICKLPRLIRLLSCNEDGVVASAALAIGNISAFSCRKFFPEMVNLGGIPLLIGLLSSRNMELIRAAARTLSRLFEWDIHDFVGQGVMPPLVNALALAFDSQRVLKAVVQAIWHALADFGYEDRMEEEHFEQAPEPKVEEDLILAGAIPYFVRLLRLGEDYKIGAECGVLTCVSDTVKSSRTAEIAFLNAGGAKSLTRFVSAIPLDYQHLGIDAISFFAWHSHKSRMEIQEAGAESILSAYLANGPNNWYNLSMREKATEALELLRSDTAGQIGQLPV